MAILLLDTRTVVLALIIAIALLVIYLVLLSYNYWLSSFISTYQWIEIRADEYNLSVYDHGLFHCNRKTLAKHLVFKNCNFDINRLYWYKDYDKYFYTSDCNDRFTISNIFRVIPILPRVRSIDYFFECLMLSHFVAEDDSRIEQLAEDGVTEVLDRGFSLCHPADATAVSEFLTCTTTLTPDACIKFTLNDREYLMAVDFFNGESSKRVNEKLTKYSALASGKQEPVIVAIVSATPLYNKVRTLVGYRMDANFTFVHNQEGLDETAVEDYVRNEILRLGEEDELRHRAEQLRTFQNELQYWIRCRHDHQINVRNSCGVLLH